ncbi:MAG: hypothetical protein AABW59_01630 [archaeon]
MQSKAFVISADSFIAFTLLLFLIMLSLFYLSQISMTSWDYVDMVNIVRDEATILEKSRSLESAIDQRSAEPLLSMLDASPGEYCFDAAIFTAQNNSLPIVYALKGGCDRSFSDLSSVERTIVSTSGGVAKFYVARISGWVK